MSPLLVYDVPYDSLVTEPGRTISDTSRICAVCCDDPRRGSVVGETDRDLVRVAGIWWGNVPAVRSVAELCCIHRNNIG